MRLSKNSSRGLTYVLVIVIVVIGAQLLVGSALGSSPLYVVVSKSMVPTLQIGDLIITEKVPFSSIHVGQVIVYQRPTADGTCPNPVGEIIVHRVLGITSRGLTTQGDDRITNPQPDPGDLIPASCVEGLVVLAVPYLGLVSMAVTYPWNYVLVGLILVFVLLSALRPSREDGLGDDSQRPDELT
jgi:signal peptidase I